LTGREKKEEGENVKEPGRVLINQRSERRMKLALGGGGERRGKGRTHQYFMTGKKGRGEKKRGKILPMELMRVSSPQNGEQSKKEKGRRNARKSSLKKKKRRKKGEKSSRSPCHTTATGKQKDKVGMYRRKREGKRREKRDVFHNFEGREGRGPSSINGETPTDG